MEEAVDLSWDRLRGDDDDDDDNDDTQWWQLSRYSDKVLGWTILCSIPGRNRSFVF
jgi:hypothetical protein